MLYQIKVASMQTYSRQRLQILICVPIAVLAIWTFSHLWSRREDLAKHFPKISIPYTGSAASWNAREDPLTDLEVEEFCSHYRLEPFPRHRMARRKVYDLLLLNTELDMLEMRMGQMSPYVDYFVIQESDQTFRSDPKPLYVLENWERFAPWHSKMIRHTLEIDPNDNHSALWDREHWSRNIMTSQIFPKLTGDQEPMLDDVMLVSDVDELFKPDTLKALRTCRFPPSVTVHSTPYSFSFQWFWPMDSGWPHPQATYYQGLENSWAPDDLRWHAKDYHFQNGGWHCSFCFATVEEMVQKITSFSHAEMDKPEYRAPGAIVKRVRAGVDV
jgi:beta-1,4-mannosyl-glycoprotein beta-1,4-N-acetylglucosaminyltransferase